MKLNSGKLQDLYHYALAIQGNGDSAFACDTLQKRLNTIDSVQLNLGELSENDLQLFKPFYGINGDNINTIDSLNNYGKTLEQTVKDIAHARNIDARTGLRITGVYAGSHVSGSMDDNNNDN